jgi:hypothetical protein
MAEPFRPDFPSNQFRVDPIYARMTLPRNTNDDRAALPSVRDLFGELSVTSQFKVTLYLGDTALTSRSDSDINAWLITAGVLGGLLPDTGSTYLNGLRYEFMCNETSLPGVSLSMAEEIGSRQGIVERFPIRRDFPEITMTFYVDAEYGIIRLFEEWMNFINPLYSTDGRLERANPRGGVTQLGKDNFFRFRYPDTYRRDIAITKFERDVFIDPNTRDVTKTPSMLTYKFIRAFPTNVTALPVTYEGSTITKTTVSFSYERYVILNHFGTGYNQYTDKPTSENGEQVPLATPSVSWTGNNTYTTASPPPFGVNSGIDAAPYINPSK